MSPTQAERVATSDRALVDAAIDLIAERGYDRTTLALIGERAGYSRGLVTQRFGNKESLLWAVMKQILDRWSTHALEPRVGDRVGVTALQTILAAYLDACESAPKRIRAYYALLREADGPMPAIRDTIRKLHGRERTQIAAIIRGGQHDGTVRAGIDPDAEATAFLGVLRGVTMQWLLDPVAVDLVGTLTQYGVSLERTLGVK
ncbi:MAG TPA: TetR/AcrR family transcriptional regulator [Acidimicrobiales bacterium]|nr:TetR/AcrR family transcriptional regulator [Acidimicrobiales bacterium]